MQGHEDKIHVTLLQSYESFMCDDDLFIFHFDYLFGDYDAVACNLTSHNNISD